MSMGGTFVSELDDLQNLIKSPGWLRVKAFGEGEWSDNITRHIGQAADDRDDVMALQKLRQVLAAQKAILRLLAWPEERIQALEQQTARERAPMTQSRRGTL